MYVRMLEAEDAEQFQSLRLRGLAECPSAFASSYEEEVFESREIVGQRLNPSGERAIFGAFVDDALVGMLGLQREGMKKLAHKAYVWGMYVAPEHRKGGIGELLVLKVLEHARKLGLSALCGMRPNSSIEGTTTVRFACLRLPPHVKR
jgi:GNAT superfamily N-acetyltransferase